MIRIFFFRDIIAIQVYTLTRMNLIRKLFLLAAWLLLIWGTYYSYNQMTGGFSLRQMTSSLPPYPQFSVSIDEEKKQALQACLSQPFTYIGKGCQFYAFESADHKYVLKFLKHKHLRPCTWLNFIPLPRKLRTVSDAKIERRQTRVQNLFSSCKLAYEELSEETGLLYIHLDRVPALESTVLLVDNLGRKSNIEVDQYEFVLQKRAIPVKEAFASVESEEQIQALIQQLIDVVLARCEKGIADRDRSFVQNVAFCASEPHALFIDTGQFYKDAQMRTEEAQKADLKKRLGNLRYWAERHFPEFLPLVDQRLNQL